MDYTFDSYHGNGVRFDSTTRAEDIQANFSIGDYVKVLDNRTVSSEPIAIFKTEEEAIDWNMAKAMAFQWKPRTKDGCNEGKGKEPWNPLEETDGFHVKGIVSKVNTVLENVRNPVKYKESKDAINPSHYQAYIETENEVLQWLEAMQYLPRFRNPECFKAAVELQGRKYFDRNGGKDEELQELQKGLWYFKFLVAYIKNGNKPIRVKDIDTILNRK